ncbi:MAG: hypothetical protein VW397_01530 [Candidatus Margulisiibacteriota bacterium]
MKSPIISILCIVLYYTITAYPNALTSFEKHRKIITTEFKSYHISNTETIQLYGAKQRKFLTKHTYSAEAVYGALFGERSGYLEGGIFIGQFMRGPLDTIVDLRVFTGAGGGGSAPQGGGFIIHPTLGFGKKISSTTFIMTEIGYMQFINGNISSMSIGISINFNSWRLLERKI